MKLKWAIIGLIFLILVLTVLEFPAPIGFETRPQDNVSMIWLAFFIIILISEISAASLIFKFPKIGGILGIIAGTLNILQVLADQFHLMQPEVAPFGYILIEDSVAIISIALIYFSYKIQKI